MAGWSWRRRLPVVVLAAALITLIEVRVGVTIAHSRHDVYRLPRAAVVTVVPALRGSGRRGWALAFLCGVPLGAGLVAVSIVSIQPPLVRCAPGSVTESERAWWGGGSGTSFGTDWVTPPGDA